MKRINIISLIGLMLVTLTLDSCCKDKSDDTEKRNREAFMTKSDVGVYNIATPSFVMDKVGHIIYINKTKKIFRVMTPEATSYAQFTLATAPVLNSLNEVELKGVNINGVPAIMLKDASVVKNDGNKYWLWSKDNDMGVIMIWM